MAEREYVWLEACVPGGGEVEPLAALVKLDLKDQVASAQADPPFLTLHS